MEGLSGDQVRMLNIIRFKATLCGLVAAVAGFVVAKTIEQKIIENEAFGSGVLQSPTVVTLLAAFAAISLAIMVFRFSKNVMVSGARCAECSGELCVSSIGKDEELLAAVPKRHVQKGTNCHVETTWTDAKYRVTTFFQCVQCGHEHATQSMVTRKEDQQRYVHQD